MRTTIEQTTFFYQLLAGGPLKAAITGDIYQDERPVDSKREDVVINTITMGTGSLQRSVSNVNIHVPNTSTGKPNHGRLNALVNIAKDILEEGYYSLHNFWTEYHGLIQDPATKGWYYNFRLRGNFLNAK